jgi:hypothetical protein
MFNFRVNTNNGEKMKKEKRIVSVPELRQLDIHFQPVCN